METEIATIETTTTELVPVSPINQAHVRIGQGMVDRVQAILTAGHGKVKKYAVSESYLNTEVLELALDDKTTLALSITTTP